MSKLTRSPLIALMLASIGFDIALAQQAGAPLPPQRPATTSPAVPAAGAPANAAPPSLDRINAYFNGMKGMRADFAQIAPDGRRFTGVLYLLRPGRMRFEYNPPATLQIVADGRTVRVEDKKLKTHDDYFIGQTPLKFLLQPKIDVAKDAKVTDLRRVGNDVVLDLEDRSTFGGTSKIRIVFAGEATALKEWTVTDAQGGSTRVMLSNLDLAATPDKDLFVIDEQKLINPK